MKDWTTYMFEDEGAGKGRVLQADVETPVGLVRVFNVHLQSLHFDHADYDAVEEGPSREEGAACGDSSPMPPRPEPCKPRNWCVAWRKAPIL